MLLSQAFHDISKKQKKFHQSSGEPTPSNQIKQSFSQPSMSVSSLSSSSSPESDATPPGLKQQCNNVNPCENGNFSKAENSSFPIEELFAKVEEAESRPPRSDSCPNGLFTDTTRNNNDKPQNGSYCYSPAPDAYSKLYDPAGSFENDTSGSLTCQAHSYNRTSSQDLSANGEALAQQGCSSNRKSYDNITDKELRKKLKNRESAQAARDRKKAKMLSLERQVNELHERYRMVESENQELRIRIQRMEATAYWREKQETNGLTPDPSGLLPFTVNTFGPLPHGANASDPTAYSRANHQYPNLCGFGEYSQHSHCIPPAAENGEESNMPQFTQMNLEAAEFHPSNYESNNIWLGDPHPTPQQGSFPNESKYSESGSLI